MIEIIKKVSPKFLLPYLKYVWNLPFFHKIRGTCFVLIDHFLTNYFLEKRKFKSGTGYELDLENPESFNQKLVWKKLNDRNPLLPVVADKYRVRQYIKDTLGKKEAKKILVPLLYVTDNPSSIPFEDLPEEYVIKANHNSGPPIFVEKEKLANKKNIVRECEKQLRTPFSLNKNEWAYKPIERKILVEEFLRGEEGQIPKDYKFFMINGTCEFIEVDLNRFSGHKRSLYDKEWNFLDITYNYPQGPRVEKPKNLRLMLKYARLLSEDFDFIRVDLYEMLGEVYFGELTHSPESGRGKFVPRSFDFKLGNKWDLKPRYWV